MGLRLTQALRNFLILRGFPSEARLWQERLLASGANIAPDVRATAQITAGEWATLTGDYPAASRLLEEGLQLARRIGDQRLIAEALYIFADTAGALDDLGRAETLAEESLALFREVGDAQRVAADARAPRAAGSTAGRLRSGQGAPRGSARLAAGAA